MRHAGTHKFQMSGPTVHSYTVIKGTSLMLNGLFNSVGHHSSHTIELQSGVGRDP